MVVTAPQKWGSPTHDGWVVDTAFGLQTSVVTDGGEVIVGTTVPVQ